MGIDQQHAREGMADYGRVLSEYLAKLVDKKTNCIEVQDGYDATASEIISNSGLHELE